MISYLCYGTYSINHLTGTVSLLPMDRNRPCEVKKVFGNFLYWGKNKNTLEERERVTERERELISRNRMVHNGGSRAAPAHGTTLNTSFFFFISYSS